ncbi:ester cyclase [Streptomyces sp. NBC_00654]|uniref:ester cyclase n=1 Tax=Streptomyces sp. NBC_00654 TaxID=2975799 RepID=UPI00224FC35A|nr:ester cyclase [Streptomyces sp. NBC_00654]MCX4967263.1 ester cyclase [Streptomyces sp. NBC_00654]
MNPGLEPRDEAVAVRFLEETEDRDRVAAYAHLCTAGCLEHDPAMPQETVGRDEAAQVYRELLAPFRLGHNVASMVAEDDPVCARFTVRGRHIGEYQGIPPSGRTFEVSGQAAALRFEGGKITEAWFNWDHQGVLEQLGVPPGSAR